MDTIQKSHPLPYYAQLAAILRDAIRDGTMLPGELLPSEAELGRQQDISRTAVRQALDALVDEGMVHKEKGRGTFVSSPKGNEFVVQEFRGFFEAMTRRGQTVTTVLLSVGIELVPPYAVTALGLSSSDEVVAIERVRKADGIPVVAVRTYLPASRFREVLDHDLTRESLYEVLRTDFDVVVGAGRRRFEAEAADAALACELELETGDPILKLTAVNQDADGIPFEYYVACYVGSRIAFDVGVGAGANANSTMHLVGRTA